MATIEELRAKALEIKNETKEGANTASRIGGFFVSVADNLETYENEALESFQTTFTANEEARDAKVDEKVSDITELQETIGQLDKTSISYTTKSDKSSSITADIPAESVKVTITNTSSAAGYFRAIFYDSDGGTSLYNTGNILINSGEKKEFEIEFKTACTYIAITNTNAKIYTISCEYGVSYSDIKSIYPSVKEIVDTTEQMPNVYLMKNATASTYNTSVSDKTDRGIAITKTSTGVQANVAFTLSGASISAGDFAFLRLRFKSTIKEWVTINLYADSSDQVSDNILVDTTEKEICFRGKAFSKAGSLHVQIVSQKVNNTELSTITISDMIVCINHYNAYADADTKNSLRDYSDLNHEFIVDKNGKGHFYSISNACKFLRTSFDVANQAYTIRVNSGVYDDEHDDVSAFSTSSPFLINKGSNRISIIGEDRDNTIIRYTNSSICQCKIIEVGSSPCTIANLTIESIKGDDYSEDTDLGNNTYCLHIDLGTNLESAYKTHIDNCRLYSECSSPIGAGLRANQTISVTNCYIISNSLINKSNGALYIHAYAGGTSDYDSTMSVEILNNILVSTDGEKALTLPDVGSSTYKTIPIIAVGNNLYSNGSEVVDSYISTRNLQKWCMGNNISALNK